MDQLFWLQVIASFIAGGVIIGFLSYLTEKAPRSMRGIIMAFPSTMLVSFVFMAHINGVGSLVQAIPGAGYALIGSMVFVLMFLFLALRFAPVPMPLPLKIFCTWIFSTLGWVIFPVLAQELPRDNPWGPFGVTIIFILILQPIFIKISNHFPSYEKTKKTTKVEMLFRMIFAGTIVALAVIISKTAGSFWGAVVGASYPASFGSQLMIFQHKYPADFLASVIRMIPIGLLPLIGYAITVTFAYPSFGIWIGTCICILVALIIGYFVNQISQKILNK